MNATLKTKIAKLSDQINKLTAERTVLQTQLDSIVDPSTISVGDVVTFLAGRGDKKVSVSGLVLGAKDNKFRVAVGSGFDAQVSTVDGDKVTAITPAAKI